MSVSLMIQVGSNAQSRSQIMPAKSQVHRSERASFATQFASAQGAKMPAEHSDLHKGRSDASSGTPIDPVEHLSGHLSGVRKGLTNPKAASREESAKWPDLQAKFASQSQALLLRFESRDI